MVHSHHAIHQKSDMYRKIHTTDEISHYLRAKDLKMKGVETKK